MRQITRTAFLATGLVMAMPPAFAQTGSPTVPGSTPAAPAPTASTPTRAQQHQTNVKPARPAAGAAQATRPATPQNPVGSATGSVQRPATTPAAPLAGATTPRSDQRSQVTPAAPAPTRTN